jgi:hypothetical protein
MIDTKEAQENVMTEALGFIDPTAGTGRKKIPLAPRPADLVGKVVGLLDNTKEQGTLILETMGQALREKHGVARVVLLRKAHYSKPATDALIDQMAQEVDVAIAALGG